MPFCENTVDCTAASQYVSVTAWYNRVAAMTYQSCHSNIDWQQEPNGFNHFSVVEGQTRLQRLKLPLTETVCSSSQERQFFLPSSTRDILVASTCKYISMRKYHHVHYVKVNLILRAIFDELWKTIGWTWRSKPSAIDQLSIHGKHFRASSCKIASQQNAIATQGTDINQPPPPLPVTHDAISTIESSR